ncbi:MAG: hypothetical protein ACRYF5_18925 [Janthinobacterium lividum]
MDVMEFIVDSNKEDEAKKHKSRKKKSSSSSKRSSQKLRSRLEKVTGKSEAVKVVEKPATTVKTGTEPARVWKGQMGELFVVTSDYNGYAGVGKILDNLAPFDNPKEARSAVAIALKKTPLTNAETANVKLMLSGEKRSNMEKIFANQEGGERLLTVVDILRDLL